jgi:type VI secretion system ImpM family protein
VGSAGSGATRSSGGTGFFGKLPGVGDFVQRRLPSAFVAAWDAAFEAAVDAARGSIGAEWQTTWQSAPPWRFALMPGVCGERAWVGVMGPASDRVGRGFPMVLAHPIETPEMLARIVAEAGGWFATVEEVHRHARAGATTSAGAFDAAVQALPDPQTWLTDGDGPGPRDGDWRGAVRTEWRRGGEDRQLAALWMRCVEAGDRCLWWTSGGARVPPAVLSTRGLPAPDQYGAFLADERTQRISRATAATPHVAPVSDDPAAAQGEMDDVLADLLAMPSSPDASPPRAGMHDDLPSGMAQPQPVAAPVSRRHEQQLTLVVADHGAGDPRRLAAVRVSAALAEDVADMRDVRERLSMLHPPLRERGEDLIDPVSEDAAVVVARVAGDCAELLRVGAAAAWHWRHGRLRPLFTTAAEPDPAVSEADTLRPGDLVGILSPAAARHAPGVGAADALRLDEVQCNVEHGDRLLLMATDTLLRLSDAALAGALQAGSGEESRARIAAAAGLGSDRAQWPVAVIEVGT